MSEELKQLTTELEKSRAEFDILATVLAQALQSLHERLDKVELWITENPKNPLPN